MCVCLSWTRGRCKEVFVDTNSAFLWSKRLRQHSFPTIKRPIQAKVSNVCMYTKQAGALYF